MSQKRVAVAMSGGVDSSVAAALLKQAGYEVSGIHMRLGADMMSNNLADLERTCQLLEIPLYKLDLEREFKQLVIDYFCQEYGRGRTPNPCVACNQYIKFDIVLERALETGADYLATGHYARMRHSPGGYWLRKAVDKNRDQSYFLYTLGQQQLERLVFPVGGLSKEKVRKKAAELGLPTADKKGSQDVCFIPDNDYRTFVAEYVPLKRGEIVDINGKILGEHSGLARYTVGQRQGLGLTTTKPLYVLKIDAESNKIVVGNREQALHNALIARNVSWVSGKSPQEPMEITAKIRYKAPEAAAELYPRDDGVEVRFVEPQSAMTPGQSVVFYQGDEVLGGGIIDAVLY
ncbi:MAG: tRNA 2-thiouridine(34) synthase MnmA [Dehalococcoidales bacterium]|nr:tRNA 2-thiouridine(34) synthase MnmA [Dehalococcoidales bacterium]